MFGRSDELEMIGELVAGVPRLQFAVDASETHVRPVKPLALSESDSPLQVPQISYSLTDYPYINNMPCVYVYPPFETKRSSFPNFYKTFYQRHAINLLKKNCRLLYLKSQSVPRSKHFSSRL